ncbi:MAG: hypothetical protein IKC11_06140 [Clostridia bacterium]|nr:hypothetical protein [Clostridia bacterium]
MKKRFKILLTIILPIMCITSLCMSFLMISNGNKTEKVEKEKVPVNKTRYEANYFAMADETSPAQGQSTSYKGGAVFLEPDSTFIMIGGTIQNHTNTYGGAIFISEGATFTMEGGTLTGCSATYGGAIYVSSGGTCNINAGTITGNTANYGPSIYAEEGAIVNISADTVIDENSVEIVTNVSISTDTIAVGNPSAGLNMYYVDFGNYPQTYVGSSMNTTLESWYNSNSPTAVNTYTVRTRTWQAYQYTDGNIYARGNRYVYSSSYTYLNGETVGSSSTTEYTWFKVEPIRWIILNYEAYTSGSDSELEIMSYLALTADIRFYTSNTDADGTAGTSDDPNQWINSELRTWLNGTFYTSAFTSGEQELISTTTVGNNITGNYDTATSNTTGVTTEDKIYCLSYWDYYNSAGLFTNTNTKMLCSPTDFTLGNYCYKFTNTSYVTATHPSGGTCYYWTRSAGPLASSACDVTAGGFLSTTYYVTDCNYGVRPALRISI